jgi:hypothetical protein
LFSWIADVHFWDVAVGRILILAIFFDSRILVQSTPAKRRSTAAAERKSEAFGALFLFSYGPVWF